MSWENWDDFINAGDKNEAPNGAFLLLAAKHQPR
jgi:hypothetical protein